jgi:hypothetical protein
MTTTYQIGSICSATLRPEDLIPAFVEALDDCKQELSLSLATDATAEQQQATVREVSRLDDLLANIERKLNGPDYFSDPAQEWGWDLDELTNELESFAPPYCYFGSHEGDGADFGFWVCHEAIDEAIADGSALKVDDTGDVPGDYSGDVFHVSDHGNLTYYVADSGKLSEVWGIV